MNTKICKYINGKEKIDKAIETLENYNSLIYNKTIENGLLDTTLELKEVVEVFNRDSVVKALRSIYRIILELGVCNADKLISEGEEISNHIKSLELKEEGVTYSDIMRVRFLYTEGTKMDSLVQLLSGMLLLGDDEAWIRFFDGNESSLQLKEVLSELQTTVMEESLK